jgi:hypothetical protein
LNLHIMGETEMRSNSGKDESRNNLRDPTIRDRMKESAAQKHKGTAGTRTSEMGSHARKSGQKGHGAHS